MESLEFRAMNTSVTLAVEEGEASSSVLREARVLIENGEKRFSRFLPDSELSNVNGSAGQWIEVSDQLFDLLALSKAYHKETGGLFDPCILPDLERAGYNVSMEVLKAQGAHPADAPASAMRRELAALELDADHRRVKLPEGMRIDLGGIAKGWLVEAAARTFRSSGGAAAVSVGGDVFFAGLPANGSKWRVEIEDPLDDSKTAAILEVGEGAVVTSSVVKRSWKQDGEHRHHLIDPRTGRPAETDWLSVTVIAPYADLAEVYAKAILIGGKERATRLMLQRPRIGVVCVDAEGRVHASGRAKEYVNVDGGIFAEKAS